MDLNINALKIQLNTSTQTLHTIARSLEFSRGRKLRPEEVATRDQLLDFIQSARKALPANPVGLAHRNTLKKIADELKNMEVL